MRFVPLLRNVALSRFGRFPLRPIPTCADSRLGQIIYSHLGRVPLRPIPTQGRFPASARSRAVRVIVALLHGGNGRVACLSVCQFVCLFIYLFIHLFVCLLVPATCTAPWLPARGTRGGSASRARSSTTSAAARGASGRSPCECPQYHVSTRSSRCEYSK
jgi:hypothetical protein